MKITRAGYPNDKQRALEIADGLESITVFFPDDLLLCQKALRSYANREGFFRRVVLAIQKPKAA